MTTPNSICEKAKVYYYDYLMKQNVELIPAEIAEHLEQCKRCKLQVELLSKELEHVDSGKNAEVNSAVVTNLRLHFAYADKPVGCKIVRPFLPGLVDETLKVRIPTPITVHLDNCEKCEGEFERIRGLGLGQKELFKLAQDFASKPNTDESGVVTCYKIKGEANTDSLLADTKTPYDQWPIEVEVLRESQEVAGAASGAEKRRVDLRPFIRPILTAAAAILVVLFVMHSNIAKAINLEQISNAIRQAKNIYIVTLDPQSTSSTSLIVQEAWISRDLNVKIGKTGSNWVLWNLNEKIQKSKDTTIGTVETKSIDDNAILKVSENMDKTLGILPFETMPEVLNEDSNAKWQKVIDETITLANTELYDLTWTERTMTGKAVYQKFRLYIDTKKYLPRKIERLHKYSKEDDYEFTTIIEVTYPTNDEISNVIISAGF